MSMAGYTKLFNSILASTIWEEDNATRIVWITLLAMADKLGVADGSVPGIASLARVKIEDCRRALLKLQAPDRDSRSDEYDGRRIKKIEGGWLILNHEKYRAKVDDDERREYLRVKKAESRRRLSEVNKCQPPSMMSTQAEADQKQINADTEAETTTIARSRALTVTYSPEFEEFWKSYPKRVGKGEAWKAWQKARPALSVVLEALAWQSASDQWNRDGGQYRPNPATYLNQRRWEDEPANPAQPVARVMPEQIGKGARNAAVWDEIGDRMEALSEGRKRATEAGTQVALDRPTGHHRR